MKDPHCKQVPLPKIKILCYLGVFNKKTQPKKKDPCPM